MNKVTTPYITTYEKSKIISERAIEISEGKPSTLKNVNGLNPLDISILEYKNKKIPKNIVRKLPNGKIEVWKLSELIDLFEN